MMWYITAKLVVTKVKKFVDIQPNTVNTDPEIVAILKNMNSGKCPAQELILVTGLYCLSYWDIKYMAVIVNDILIATVLKKREASIVLKSLYLLFNEYFKSNLFFYFKSYHDLILNFVSICLIYLTFNRPILFYLFYDCSILYCMKKLVKNLQLSSFYSNIKVNISSSKNTATIVLAN
jgi:hypothetical protein